PPDRVTELEHELAQERLRRASAEQLAQERQDRIADLQQAMRLLEAPRPTPGSPGPNPWVSDLGQPAQMTHPDLGHDRSPQVRHGSDEPPSRSTDLGQDGSPEPPRRGRSGGHTAELQSRLASVCPLLPEKQKQPDRTRRCRLT